MLNKKGQSLGGIYGGVLVVASIGILLALVLYILSSIGTSLQIPNTAGSIINETGASIKGTGYTVSRAGVNGFASPVITAIWNSTGSQYNQSIAVGNATITSAGVVRNSTAVNYGNVSISYTYTYTADTASSNATGTIISQFVSFLPWLGIILLVLAAGVVLFFIIRSFAGSSRGV